MDRQPPDQFRLLFSLFHGMPPLSRALYLPGLAALAGYIIFTVLFDARHDGQAFVTAFLLGFAVYIACGFEGLMRRVLTLWSGSGAAFVALALIGLPLVILALADDAVWCQRMQSAVYLVIAGVFLNDLVRGRVATSASLWPDAGMRNHLPNLTRGMVLLNGTLLVLNETMIFASDLSQWLMFWAILPLVSQMLVRAMVLTVINLDDNGQPV